MINFYKVGGSIAERMKTSDKMLEGVFDELGHNCKGKKVESLQKILNEKLPFYTRVSPLDDKTVAGYMYPAIDNGKFIGAKIALPHDEFLNIIKLRGEDMDTCMHEIAHSTHYYVDKRFGANIKNCEKAFQKSAAMYPQYNLNETYKEFNKLYTDEFYSTRYKKDAQKFVDSFKEGGKAKTNAVRGRLQNIDEQTQAILNKLPPDRELKIAILKRMRDGLLTENYAWAQGAKFKAQSEIDSEVLNLIEKDGNRKKLLDLEFLNKERYEREINKYFEKAGIEHKTEELNQAIEFNNDIAYMFEEKIKYLNDQIASLIRGERCKMAFLNSCDKWSTQITPKPRPVQHKSALFCEFA